MEKDKVRQVVHDFNNILTTIKNSLELLRQKLEDKPETHYLLQNIDNGTNRVKNIVGSLLEKDNKNKDAEKIKTSTLKLLEELISALKDTFPKSISITTNICNELNKILCTPNDIYRVLLNLCVNAKEAIKEKGEITILGCNLIINDENADEYYPLTNGNYIKIKVTDTGEGIPEKNLPHIFKDGFSTKNKKNDSGLGLHIVSEIIKDHNGIIKVKSIENKGTTFTIILPSLKRKELKLSDNSKKTILLGEDETDLADVLSDLFESYNYNVKTAENGVEVLEILENSDNKIDILVIDKKMPLLDGISCIKKIRQTNSELKIILASGSPCCSSERFDIDDLKINKMLDKPYNFDELLEIIRELIS